MVEARAAYLAARQAEPTRDQVTAARLAVDRAQQRATAAERLAAKAEGARLALDQASQALADGAQAQADLQAAIAAQAAAGRDVAALSDAREELTQAQGDLVALQRALTDLQDQDAALHATRTDQAALVATLGERLRTLEALAAATDALDLHATGLRQADDRWARLVVAFGVDGIPARIIEAVLPELAGLAQSLLTDLRPGMQLDLRAQRAGKAGGVIESLDIVVDGRPLAMASGGERTSVALALAVGLARLQARRAGTAIRTLVIDEPDGLDVDARRALGAGLRVLAHSGELQRVVLISHHQDLAEAADTVYTVDRTGGPSTVHEE
jgi:DNA repair exonuclease SbcCD ATPase subunit